MKAKKKVETAIHCYVCRKKFVEVTLSTTIFFEIAYDFCPHCVGWMERNFERDMIGLHLLPLVQKPQLRLEGK